MNLHKLIFTENDCYKAVKTITPKGIMVHSTGANNPNLKRYVGPDDGLLGVNQYNNHWNTATPGGMDSIPRLVAYETYCGYPLLIETAIVGPLMSPAAVRANRDVNCDLLLEWLVTLERSTASTAFTSPASARSHRPTWRASRRANSSARCCWTASASRPSTAFQNALYAPLRVA